MSRKEKSEVAVAASIARLSHVSRPEVVDFHAEVTRVFHRELTHL
ncbi:hypothetical protein [Roseibium polysiphoniae]